MYFYDHVGKSLQEEKVANVLVSFLSAYPKLKGSTNQQGRKDVQAFIGKVQESRQD